MSLLSPVDDSRRRYAFQRKVGRKSPRGSDWRYLRGTNVKTVVSVSLSRPRDVEGSSTTLGSVGFDE